MTEDLTTINARLQAELNREIAARQEAESALRRERERGQRCLDAALSSGTDVTDRRQAEEAERASERRYRTLFEYAPDGILIADGESRYLDANPSICRMLGYARDELVGLSASDIVAGAEVEHIAPALYEIKFSSDYHREWQFRRKDGSLFTADVIARSMPDGNLLGVIRDVTERNRVVAALRETEERKRFALDNANVGIWDVDYATGLLRWSAISEAHYGVPIGTFPGTFEAFIERIHPDDRASSLAIIADAMKVGSDFTIQHRTIHPDGTVHWLHGAGRILLGEDGAPVRGVGISQDVTELHRLNDEIRRQRLQVFKATIRTVQDIVNNMLNSFQLVRLEAEGHLSAEILALIDGMVAEAALKLRMLGELETVSERAMAIGEGIDYPGAGS